MLLRYLVADDAEQHAAAAALIEEGFSPENPGLVHAVALCEVVWALRQIYKVPKADIVRALRLILRVESLRVLDEAHVRTALALYEAYGADFADALLHAAYQAEGSGLATFDRATAQFPRATLVGTLRRSR